MLFYAWFGVVLFYGTEQGTRDFPNLIEALWTLWICVTTANYPDVMMPAYNENRLSSIFFVSFMILIFFFLMNLVLAAVVNAYDESIKNRKKKRAELAQENLSKAFELMDTRNEGSIGRAAVMGLLMVLNDDFPEIHKLGRDEAKLLFGFLDKDGNQSVTFEEFQEFGILLLVEFTKQSDYATFVEVNLPTVAQSSWYKSLCELVKSSTFEYVVDALLVANAVVIGIQSYPELAGNSVALNPQYVDRNIDTRWEIYETVFTFLYVVEVFLKIMVNGWKRYTETARNVFDFAVTGFALIATVYVYYPNKYNDTHLIRLIVMARVLRLGRLLMAIPAFQLFGTISVEILPAAVDVILVLFFLMYFFSAMGVILYGGMITRDPNNPLSTELLDTSFSGSEYWANNFNDMMSSMNVLFNLLVVNNWTICEEGFEAVTGGKWVRLFFFSFHVLGVILVNNLVIAFILNAVFQQLETLNKRKGVEVVDGEAIIEGERAIFDASEITGTATGATGGYIARIRSLHADVEIDEREGLRRLFSRQGSSDSEGR